MPTTEEKFQSIDAETRAKLDTGFVFQGKIFSLSANSQITLTNLYLACKFAQEDLLVSRTFSLPFLWNTKDDRDYIILADPSTVSAFYATALSAVAAALKGGTTQKVVVRFTDLGVEIPVLPGIRKSASELFDTPTTTSEEVGVEIPPAPDPPPEEVPPEEVPPEDPPPEVP